MPYQFNLKLQRGRTVPAGPAPSQADRHRSARPHPSCASSGRASSHFPVRRLRCD